MEVSDIIIGYGEQNIANMNNITKAIQTIPVENNVRLSYLRTSQTGVFERQIVTVKVDPLGAGMMPI